MIKQKILRNNKSSWLKPVTMQNLKLYVSALDLEGNELCRLPSIEVISGSKKMDKKEQFPISYENMHSGFMFFKAISFDLRGKGA